PRSQQFLKLLIPALRFGLVGLLQKSALCVGPASPRPRQGFGALRQTRRSVNGVAVHPTSGSESPGARGSARRAPALCASGWEGTETPR
ncbi:MAG TPA: hypothetical protein DCQ98_12890, partial [Planctomycetaceae bacterium]|nr:hypothetical protein [Planctomycetaceae bacterium]